MPPIMKNKENLTRLIIYHYVEKDLCTDAMRAAAWACGGPRLPFPPRSRHASASPFHENLSNKGAELEQEATV